MKKYISIICLLLSSCGPLQTADTLNENISGEKLIIAHADTLESFSPFQSSLGSRQRLGHTYEGLISYDPDFNIEPKLALAWGNKDNVTWEFTIRENVRFHNGKALDILDVIYSFEKARESESLNNILSNILYISGEQNKLTITTKDPDPSLLTKIQQVYIVPKDYLDSQEYKDKKPVGTGPYKFEKSDDTTFSVTRNESYWGAKPYFQSVDIRYIAGRMERNNDLIAGNLDILSAVPPQVLPDLQQNPEIILHYNPSLTIYFLGFNTKEDIKEKENPFAIQDIRTIVDILVNRDAFVAESGGLLAPVYQLVSANIFGYNSEYEFTAGDAGKIDNLLRAHDLKQGFSFDLVTTEDLTKPAQNIKDALSDYKITANLVIEDPAQLVNKLNTGDAHVFIIGWKFDGVDPTIYLKNFYHSQTDDEKFGGFNFFNFSNKKIDTMIEKQEMEFDEEARLKQLKEIFSKIGEETIAIPLLEPKQVYASQGDIIWGPRLDGLVLGQEVSKKDL